MQASPPSFDARPDADGGSDSADGDRGQTTLDFAVGISLFLISVAVVVSFAPNLVEPFSDGGTADTVVANRAASQLVQGTLADPSQPYVLDKACTVAFFAPENSDGDPNDDEHLNDEADAMARSGDERLDISTDSLWDPAQCNFHVAVSNDSDYLHARLGVAGVADDGSVDRARSPGLQIEIRGDPNGDGTDHILCLDANEQPGPDGTMSPDDPDVEDPIIEVPDNEPFDDDGDDCDAASGDYDIPFQVGESPPEETGSVVVGRRVVTIDGIRATVIVRVW
jgi:hypothetical protein